MFRSSTFPLPSQSTVKLVATISIVGGIVSSIVNVAVVDAEFPHPSVAVKVTVAEPVSPHSSESSLKLFDQLTAEQLSVAVAPPCVANQLLRSSIFPLPSHCTVKFEPPVTTGGTVS